MQVGIVFVAIYFAVFQVKIFLKVALHGGVIEVIGINYYRRHVPVLPAVPPHRFFRTHHHYLVLVEP